MQHLQHFLLAVSLWLFFTNCGSSEKQNAAVALKAEQAQLMADSLHLADSLRVADSLNRTITLSKVPLALDFCKKNDYNTSYCFLVNMRIHSGLTRFFVWDFNKNAVIDSGLVSHGCGKLPWSGWFSADKPVFSNTHESHTSSLGKYRVGKRDVSQWGVGIKYYLYGLESTNSNALERQIVFHSWNMMSETETYPYGSPEGWGCPALANEFFLRTDSLLQQSDRPFLMWIFNE